MKQKILDTNTKSLNGVTIGELETIATSQIKDTDLFAVETDLTTNSISVSQVKEVVTKDLLKFTNNQLGSIVFHPAPAGYQNIQAETNGFGDAMLVADGRLLNKDDYPDFWNFIKVRKDKGIVGFLGETIESFKIDELTNKITLPNLLSGKAVYMGNYGVQDAIFPQHTMTSGIINITTQEHSHSYTDDGIFGPNGGGYSGGDITGQTRNKTTASSTVIINPFTVSSSNISNLPNGVVTGNDYKVAGIKMIPCIVVKPTYNITAGSGGSGGGGGIATQDLDMNLFKIVNLGNPTAESDAVRLVDLNLDNNKIAYRRNGTGGYDTLQNNMDLLFNITDNCLSNVTGQMQSTYTIDKIINPKQVITKEYLEASTSGGGIDYTLPKYTFYDGVNASDGRLFQYGVTTDDVTGAETYTLFIQEELKDYNGEMRNKITFLNPSKLGAYEGLVFGYRKIGSLGDFTNSLDVLDLDKPFSHINERTLFMFLPSTGDSIKVLPSGIEIKNTAGATKTLKINSISILGDSNTVITDQYHFTTKKYVDDSLVTDNIIVSGTVLKDAKSKSTKAPTILTSKLVDIDSTLADHETRIVAVENVVNPIKTLYNRKFTRTTAGTIQAGTPVRILDIMTQTVSPSFEPNNLTHIFTSGTNAFIKEKIIGTYKDAKLEFELRFSRNAAFGNTTLEFQILRVADNSIVAADMLTNSSNTSRNFRMGLNTSLYDITDPYVAGGYYLVVFNRASTDFAYDTLELKISKNIDIGY